MTTRTLHFSSSHEMDEDVQCTPQDAPSNPMIHAAESDENSNDQPRIGSAFEFHRSDSIQGQPRIIACGASPVKKKSRNYIHKNDSSRPFGSIFGPPSARKAPHSKQHGSQWSISRSTNKLGFDDADDDDEIRSNEEPLSGSTSQTLIDEMSGLRVHSQTGVPNSWPCSEDEAEPSPRSSEGAATEEYDDHEEDSFRMVEVPEPNSNPFMVLDAPNSEGRKRQRPRLLPASQDQPPSRYLMDFEQLEMLGRGQFGTVQLARKRLDGMNYAIKRKKLPLMSGEAEYLEGLREVFALACLADCPFVTRYFDAWREDDFLFVQIEYLSGGTLESNAVRACGMGHPLNEFHIRPALLDIARAIEFMHGRQIAHLDVKPSNIIATSGGSYKLGDFGMAVGLDSPMSVSEGDQRYLLREMMEVEDLATEPPMTQLQFASLVPEHASPRHSGIRIPDGEDASPIPTTQSPSSLRVLCLKAADTFALALSAYELAMMANPPHNYRLPDGGEEWHDVREGRLFHLNRKYFSESFEGFVRTTLQPRDLAGRPAIEELVRILEGGSTQTVTPTPSAKDMRSTIAALEDENARLRDRLEELEGRPAISSPLFHN